MSDSADNKTLLARALPEDIIAKAESVGRQYHVSGALHPLDFMFWFIYDDPARTDKLDAPILYAQSGREVVTFLRGLLEEEVAKAALAKRPVADARVSVLEFASGYGRASRHFGNELPYVDLVACDIHEEAIAFLSAIGITACRSSPVPEELHTDRHFDVVFALSFFTHMPRSTWSRWLRALADQLEPDGLLIFTAHGEASQRAMGVATIEADGFFYTPWSEQKDLPLSDYGGTITVFDFVYKQLVECGLTLLHYKQVAIAHHDVYVVQRGCKNAFEPLKSESVQRLVAENRRMTDELHAMQASHSWRITAPIRALSRTLARG